MEQTERAYTQSLEEGAKLYISAGAFGLVLSAKEIEHHWNAISHYPERRALSALADLKTMIDEFAAHLAGLAGRGGQLDEPAEMERYARKAVAAHQAYWHALGRCMSSFIVGPSNFPVARAQKRTDTADRRRMEINEHDQAARKAAKRHAFPHGAPGEAIRSDNPEALALITAKIDKAQQIQERMKATNKAIRGAKGNPERQLAALVAMGYDHGRAAQLLRPDFAGRVGFPDYALSNNLANIKRMEARKRELEAMRGAPPKETATVETAAGAVEVVENTEAARIQLIFPDKPDAETRTKLKRHGFRWSPRFGAWQRHLNNAGRFAAEQVLTAIAA